MKQLIVKNFWLKMLALFLAVVVWLYVVGELNKGTPEEKAVFELIRPYRVSAREVPIKPTLIGKPRPGFKILHEAVSVRPSVCLITAPKNILKNITYITTEDIDIGELTRSAVSEVKIKPISGVILEKPFYVTVVVPVKKE